MILNDDECRTVYNDAMELPGRSAVSVTRAVEAAVIRKLAAGVSVEPVAARWPSVPGSHHYAGAGGCSVGAFGPDSEDLFTLDQLSAAIAAARVQENERCLAMMDAIGCDWRDAGDMAKFYATNYLREAIRALLGKEVT